MGRFLIHSCIRGGSWYNCVVLPSSSLHVGGFYRPQSEVKLRLMVTLTDEGLNLLKLTPCALVMRLIGSIRRAQSCLRSVWKVAGERLGIIDNAHASATFRLNSTAIDNHALIINVNGPIYIARESNPKVSNGLNRRKCSAELDHV